MSSNARKKEKHRLKRKQKHQQLRKLNSRTALQRIAAEGGQIECWVNPDDWKEKGMASIQVLGQAPGGRAAFAAFLVDLWAVGLKDAFGRSDVNALDFREGQLEPWIEETGAVPMDPAVARRLVSGGVRFGRQNGFRMPPQWEKFAVIFGRDILDEIPTADTSDFGIDGGLRYVGTMEFLHKRLTVPPSEFFARPNVHYIIEADPDNPLPGVPDELADDPEELAEHFEEMTRVTSAGARRLIERAREWCARQGPGADPDARGRRERTDDFDGSHAPKPRRRPGADRG